MRTFDAACLMTTRSMIMLLSCHPHLLKRDEYNADKSSSDFSDIPAFPENFGTKAKEIAEAIAIATAARLLKRPT